MFAWQHGLVTSRSSSPCVPSIWICKWTRLLWKWRSPPSLWLLCRIETNKQKKQKKRRFPAWLHKQWFVSFSFATCMNTRTHASHVHTRGHVFCLEELRLSESTSSSGSDVHSCVCPCPGVYTHLPLSRSSKRTFLSRVQTQSRENRRMMDDFFPFWQDFPEIHAFLQTAGFPRDDRIVEFWLTLFFNLSYLFKVSPLWNSYVVTIC